MATTFADLEARLRGHEARLQRAEEDVTAIIETVVETRDDVRKLHRLAVRNELNLGKILDHLSIVPATEQDVADAIGPEEE